MGLRERIKTIASEFNYGYRLKESARQLLLLLPPEPITADDIIGRTIICNAAKTFYNEDLPMTTPINDFNRYLSELRLIPLDEIFTLAADSDGDTQLFTWGGCGMMLSKECTEQIILIPYNKEDVI